MLVCSLENVMQETEMSVALLNNQITFSDLAWPLFIASVNQLCAKFSFTGT